MDFPTQVIDDYNTSVSNYNCTNINGKYYYINKRELDIIDVNQLTKYINVYKNEDISKLDNGLYLWILTENKNGYDIYYMNVFSFHEFKSKHSNLVNILKLNQLNLAGEMFINDKTITYNFQSGTYMIGKVDIYEPDLFVKNGFETFLKKYTNKNIKYNSESMISEKTIPLTYNDLNILYKLGVPISVYTNIEDCIKNKDHILNMIRYETRLNMFNKIKAKYGEGGEEPILPKIPPKGTPYKPIRRSNRLIKRKIRIGVEDSFKRIKGGFGYKRRLKSVKKRRSARRSKHTHQRSTKRSNKKRL